LGSWAQGGGEWGFGWGPQDDSDSIAAIHRALEVGVNWIDTAPVYGLGHAEEVLGRALKEIPSESRPIVATKCGRGWSDPQTIVPNLKPEAILQEIDMSLARLGVEVIDLYQIHWPQPDDAIEEAWETIGAIIKQGKVRYAGVSNFNVSQLKRVHAIHPVASLQPPYSMLSRDPENELLSFCAANRIGIVAYSPMQKGLLTGKFDRERLENLHESDHRRRDSLFQEPAFSATLRLIEELRPIAEKNGKTLAQLSIAWVLRRPEVTAAIVGARRPAQIEETAAAGDWELSDEDKVAIESLLTRWEEETRG
jgi:aryl-alcohol dehydrogenase-like predicted oxidoreductase